MAFKYTGDATLGVSLTVQTPKPLDSRTVVNSIEDLYTIPERYAYQGMTVSNVGNGNIYMLVDKAKITEKAGWKASYESIQIITCTDAEYKEWAANTTEDFKPIDEGKTYLHEDTYYYIYEDSISEDQEYLSAAWGKQIEEQLKQKALNTTVVALQQQVNADIENLKNNYLTSDQIAEKYALQSSLNTEDPESLLSKVLSAYYTSAKIDEIFVTKESLRGEGMEGDDFVFVTQTQYDKDKEKLQAVLDTTLKTNQDGSLSRLTIENDLTVNQIKSPQGTLIIDIKEDGLHIGTDKVAMEDQIPNLITLSQEEYENLQQQDQLEEDTYYYTYGETGDKDTGYVRSEDLSRNYYNRRQIDELIQSINAGRVNISIENETLIIK